MKNRVMRKIGEIVVEGFYNHQQARISAMNQIRDVIRHIHEGIPWDQPEDKKDEETFSREYKDENLLPLTNEMFERNLLTEQERDYIVRALDLARKAASLENSHKPSMKAFVSSDLIWETFLFHIAGIGEILGANLIANLGNCEKFDNISALWRYCGFHVVCPTCTEKRETRSGKKQTFPVCATADGKCPICGTRGVGEKRAREQGIDFNPSLRMLMYKIADCLIKKNSPVYREIYDEHKAHQLAKTFAPGELLKMYPPKKKKSGETPKPVYKETDIKLSPGHAHARAMRKMMKVFLSHYWVVSRTIGGLPITDPYVQAHMNHTGIRTWQDVVRANGGKPASDIAA